MTHKHKNTLLAVILASTGILAACGSWNAELKEVTAERIARPAFMVDRRLDTGKMDFQLWERMHKRGAPANVYIEGDGRDVFFRQSVSVEPTPDNPVALHLASRDNADNLVYISRPCQFRESGDYGSCPPQYWSNQRFGPEVIEAYHTALDEIRTRYDVTEINLIGYDGGANIAAALAASRNDVASLRTVAGVLSPNLVYKLPIQALDQDNVLANVVAPSLANMPQHHFIGAGDEITPPAVYHSFRQAMGETGCVHYTLVQDADHTRGWVEKWPDLLMSSMDCPPPYVPAALPPLPPSKDGPNK